MTDRDIIALYLETKKLCEKHSLEIWGNHFDKDFIMIGLPDERSMDADHGFRTLNDAYYYILGYDEAKKEKE